MPESPVPVYKTIADEIVRRIHEGLYPPHTYLPSENELAREFRVTRTTIRRVLEILKHQGTLESFQGKGYQVRPLYWEQSLLQFYSFGRDIEGRAGNTATKLVSFKSVDGLSDIAEFRNLALWEITRLRFVEETPIILETSYIPREFLKDPNERDVKMRSLYDLFEENGVHVVRAREYLEPVLPEGDAGSLLGVPSDQPLFQTTRYTYDNKDTLVEFRESLIRGDRFRFFVDMKV